MSSVPPSEVEQRLSALLLEIRRSGLPVPLESVWARRYPAHPDAVRRAFARLRAEEPVEDAAEIGAESPALPPPAEVAPANAGPMPRAPVPVREDAHGTLCESEDGWVYRIPAARLAGKGPASLYLARAERLESVGPWLFGRPAVRRLDDGSAEVRIPKPPKRRLDLDLRRTDRRGRTRRVLAHVARIARILERAHEAEAAHGRLEAGHLRIDLVHSRLHLDFGLDSGPGLDGPDLLAAKVRDLRALGALLYGALCLEGKTPDTGEILARADAGELPVLGSRRPDLLPALLRIVDRALSPDASARYSGLSPFVADLERVLDMEVTSPAGAQRTLSANRRLRAGAAVIGALVITAAAFVAAAFHKSKEGRIHQAPPPDPRIEEIRALRDQGLLPEAKERLEQLARELGLR